MKSQIKSNEQWRKILTPEQYRVLRESATDVPFANKYNDNHKEGKYYCAGCGALLFESGKKFDSGSGWPSFTAPAVGEAVELVTDNSHGMSRVEVRCAQCQGHLGHVFDDGPPPAWQRYCINSTSLDFKGA